MLLKQIPSSEEQTWMCPTNTHISVRLCPLRVQAVLGPVLLQCTLREIVHFSRSGVPKLCVCSFQLCELFTPKINHHGVLMRLGREQLFGLKEQILPSSGFPSEKLILASGARSGTWCDERQVFIRGGKGCSSRPSKVRQSSWE